MLVSVGAAQWGTTILYIAIMVAILIKPMGLFGKKVIKKV
jgi:branched-chain amino acid transport system permease protein